MDTAQFDRALLTALFQRAALVGWRDASLVDAARDAALDLARVRLRFPNRAAALVRFGAAADQAVLAAVPAQGTPREKLFDLLMSRFDQLQQHRDGMLALMAELPASPGTALLLYGGTLRSMRWMLDAAGVPSGGVLGALRVHGLAAVWGYGLRAWQEDEGSDLPRTMAAVDRGLDRAMQAEASLPGHHAAAPGGASVEPMQPPPPPMVAGLAAADAPDGPAVL